MYMVVALLVWAVWIIKKRIQNSENRIQKNTGSEFCRKYEVPLVSRIVRRRDFSFAAFSSLPLCLVAFIFCRLCKNNRSVARGRYFYISKQYSLYEKIITIIIDRYRGHM